MPVTEAAVQDFLAKLSAVRPITSRKMFGGIGIYCEGTFFAVIDDDRLYFKVDDQNLPDYEARGASQWVIEGMSNGGPMPYREVPADVLASTVLGDWIDKAVQVALRKKKK